MKVICINYGYKVHPENTEYVKEGSVYTVVKEVKGYSDLAQREVDCYEFEGLSGFFEKGMFAPLSNFDERLIHLLRTNTHISHNLISKIQSPLSAIRL